MRLLQADLRNLIDTYSSEHKTQLDLMNQSIVGFWTNRLFNVDPPQVTVWLNAYSYVLRSGTELSHGKLKEGAVNYFKARYNFLKALKAYTKWKDGIEGAGTKMQWAIAGTGLATVLSFVALAEAAGAVGLEAGYSATTTAAARVYTAEELLSSAQQIDQVLARVAAEEQARGVAPGSWFPADRNTIRWTGNIPPGKRPPFLEPGG